MLQQKLVLGQILCLERYVVHHGTDGPSINSCSGFQGADGRACLMFSPLVYESAVSGVKFPGPVFSQKPPVNVRKLPMFCAISSPFL